MNLQGAVATTEVEVETMRRLRNDGREQMTEDRSLVSRRQQMVWWERVSRLPAVDFQPIIYRFGDEIIGYGMLTRRDGRLCVSLSVAMSRRGEGFGTRIYRDLAARAGVLGERCWAIVFRDNVPSLLAALRAGYEQTEERGDTVTLASVI